MCGWIAHRSTCAITQWARRDFATGRGPDYTHSGGGVMTELGVMAPDRGRPVPADKRLVLAIEQDAKVDICTTLTRATPSR